MPNIEVCTSKFNKLKILADQILRYMAMHLSTMCAAYATKAAIAMLDINI